jgi:N4-(beta-N-acetylglucosaminyl)-L-asparaginase
MQVVEGMRHGLSPQAAAEAAVRRMVRKYPGYVGALLAVDRHGRHAAACHGWTFTYAVRSAGMSAAQVYTVESLKDAIRETAAPDGVELTA